MGGCSQHWWELVCRSTRAHTRGLSPHACLSRASRCPRCARGLSLRVGRGPAFNGEGRTGVVACITGTLWSGWHMQTWRGRGTAGAHCGDSEAGVHGCDSAPTQDPGHCCSLNLVGDKTSAIQQMFNLPHGREHSRNWRGPWPGLME